jgi:hypothetical protein
VVITAACLGKIWNEEIVAYWKVQLQKLLSGTAKNQKILCTVTGVNVSTEYCTFASCRTLLLHFQFLFPSLCGLSMFKTLYSVLNTCHFKIFTITTCFGLNWPSSGVNSRQGNNEEQTHTKNKRDERAWLNKITAIFLLNNFLTDKDGQFRPKHVVILKILKWQVLRTL